MQVCGDLLVELQVEYKGCTKGFHQEAALGQMDGLKESKREGEGVCEHHRRHKYCKENDGCS